jgi:TonB-linked SusC/RagA family outer membrane protein
MKKILLFSVMLLTLLVNESWAQDRTITGKVTSEEDGSGLPGVNVILKGTTTGTTTDVDGSYRLNVPQSGGTLIFSFIGFSTTEAAIGSRSVVDLSMSSDFTQLSEVIVTAMGVERQSRELGYGISSVSSDELTVARESNILNSLQGKITGVNITQSNGNLGSSSKVVIRGVSSLSGRNNPLWVVDGIPINDAHDNTSAGGNRIAGNRDFANGAAVVNPDDIATITVLKGASATSLYGSRAAAGVIVVTTKRGKASKQGGPSVTINSSLRFDNLFRVPEYQNEYGGGANYKYDSTATGNNWGPRIVGQEVTQLGTGIGGVPINRVPLTAYPDNYKDYFRLGKTMINNVAVSDGNDRGDYRLSITSLNQSGILPNAELDRVTASFNAGMRHSDKLKSRFGFQYINTKSQGTGVQGANDPNIFGLNSFVRSTDFKNFLPWIDASGNQLGFASPFDNNPFWLQNENKNEREDQRFIGNFETTYSPIQELSFTARVGYDFDQDNRLITNRVGTRSRVTGDFLIDKINRSQLNLDLISTYFKELSGNLGLKALAGFNYNRREFSNETLFSQNLSIPELFNPANALTNQPTRGFSEQILMGAFAEASLSYKDWATLTVSGRNDWSSTLPADNRSYFYPSANLAFVFTDALSIDSRILNYGKLRLSAAQVGNDTGPYQLDFNYFPQSQASGQYGLNVNFPYNGRLGFQAQTRIPPVNLKPERQTSIELGTELQFLESRLVLDVSYYKSNNDDQILAIPIPQSTGFSTKTLNVGRVVQEGIEVSLEAKILDRGGFRWNSIVNFTHNVSIVEKLAEGTERIVIASEFNNVQVVAVPGKQFQLFTSTWLTDSASGRPIINPANGLRQPGPVETRGSVMPNFTMGFVNNISYKNFTLSATIDWRSGGSLYSSTVAGLQTSGASAETAVNREGTFIDKYGVLVNADGTVRDNDIPARSSQTFWNSLAPAGSSDAFIYDASFIKLREMGISYNFPASMLGSSFIRGLQIGVEGRNLALLYSKVPHIDPEATLFGAGADGFGVERNTVPSTRSIGFNVRLTF